VKILVERLPPDITERQLRLAFELYGHVAAVQVRLPGAEPWLPYTSGLVDMPDPAAAALAVRCLMGCSWGGVEYVNVKCCKPSETICVL
jgi:hypothetical protein